MEKIRSEKYYHGTDYNNLGSIVTDGLKRGCDGIVYLTKTKEDALKFMALRFLDKVVVIEVEVDPKDVIETFDHSEAFFKCRSYGCTKDIPVENLKTYTLYDFNK